MKKIILAVVGLTGSGKTEIVEYLIKKTGWPKVYFGDVTFNEMKKREIEINETNERKMREEIREKFGMEAYATLSLPKIKEAYVNSSVIVESLYSWEEYLEMKKEFPDAFKVLAVYSSPKTRARRMGNRSIRPLQEQELISRDYSQMKNLHQASPIAYADFMIINEGAKEDLYQEIEKALLMFFL